MTPDERQRPGYTDTVREICQQPDTWEQTADDLIARADEIAGFLHHQDGTSARPVVLTGSGSSLYVAECAALSLQAQLGVVVRAIPAALLLTDVEGCLTAADQALVVSFARSGDSPESTAILDLLLHRSPFCRHLPITCNALGKLATAYREEPRVMTLVLDPRTNDRSLVMTSSFTNMLIAAQMLGRLTGTAAYRRAVRLLAAHGREVLARYVADLARIARLPFRSACFLGSGSRLGAARECALKMLEMSGGEVGTIAETPLGLRHGPMAAIRNDTLLVASIPSSPLARGYAVDVLREIRRKQPGARLVAVGDAIPEGVIEEGDVAVGLPGLNEIDDGDAAVIDVLVGQLLALFRCLAGGLRPDKPSPDGMISRVVPDFPIYR
jgi:tagatose-6-phosphate ketose/aldose isomerase